MNTYGGGRRLKRRPIRAALVYSLVVALLATACGDGGGEEEATGEETVDGGGATDGGDVSEGGADPASAEGGSGERLRVLLPDFGDESFDPTVMSTAYAFEILSPMYDSLLHISPEGEVAPGVAESWEINDANDEITFTIRSDMQFHNGDPVTAQDVQYSLGRWFDPEVGATVIPPFANFLDQDDPMSSIEAVDDQTLVVQTPNGPAEEFLPTVSLQQQHEAYVLPMDYLEEVGIDQFLQEPVGSGPWRLVEHNSGDSMVFEAVEDHPYRETPAFEELELAIAPEEATRLAALENGEADIVPIEPESVDDVESLGCCRIGEAEQAIQIHMFFNGGWNEESGAIADPRVREALSLAIDREELVNQFLAGYGTPTPGALPGEFFPGMAGMEIEDWEGELYNPERAQELLEEAGYADGFQIDVIAFEQSGAPYQDSLGEVFLAYWEPYGITGEIVPTDLATFFDWAEIENIDERTLGTVAAFRRRRGYSATQAANGYNNAETPGASVMGPPGETLIPDVEGRIEALTSAEGEERARLGGELLQEVSELYIAPSLFYGSALWGIGNRAGNWEAIEGRSQLGEVYETVQPS